MPKLHIDSVDCLANAHNKRTLPPVSPAPHLLDNNGLFVQQINTKKVHFSVELDEFPGHTGFGGRGEEKQLSAMSLLVEFVLFKRQGMQAATRKGTADAHLNRQRGAVLDHHACLVQGPHRVVFLTHPVPFVHALNQHRTPEVVPIDQIL